MNINHEHYSYIQSFNESAYKPLEVQARVNRELMETLAWNPLAIYRTFWRFENFIKAWVTGEIQGSHFHRELKPSIAFGLVKRRKTNSSFLQISRII